MQRSDNFELETLIELRMYFRKELTKLAEVGQTIEE